jgi:hypothetical protein
LRLVQEASGYTSQWWEDRQLLVHFTRTWADLWHTSQPSLQIWAMPLNWSGQPDSCP